MNKRTIGRITPEVKVSGHDISLPAVFTFELTTACNNFCTGCANIELRDHRRLSLGNNFATDWKTMMERVIAVQPDAIFRLSGGEPTLHPDFFQILDFLERKRIRFALLSTGRWKKINAQLLIHRLKCHPGFLGVLVSVHGTTANVHCAFTNNTEKSFQETCDNIRAASDAGITVFTNTVITGDNWHQVAQIINFSTALGAKMAVFNRFIAHNHPLLPSNEQLMSAIDTVRKLKISGEKCRWGNSLPKCFMGGSAYAPPAGYELCHVSPDGKIRPDNFSRFSFGNLLTEDFPVIWRSEKAAFFRNSIPRQCLDCAALKSCRGGLKSLSLGDDTTFGDPLMQTPLNFEQIQAWDDDKEKKVPVILALTSD